MLHNTEHIRADLEVGNILNIATNSATLNYCPQDHFHSNGHIRGFYLELKPHIITHGLVMGGEAG